MASSSAAETIKKEFGHTRLYEILGIAKGATEKEIKKAYLRAALRFHPDRNPGDGAATAKFQALGLVHAVLSDADRRAVFDEHGEIDAEDAVISSSWVDYWRALFPSVTEDRITAFRAKYVGSAEEREDVLRAYRTHDGDISAVLESVSFAEGEEDEARVRGIVSDAIDAGDLVKAASGSSAGRRGAARRKRARRGEAAEAEALAREMAARRRGGAIARRGGRMRDLAAAMEAKYGQAGGPPDVDDAEFEKIRAKLDARRRAKGAQ